MSSKDLHHTLAAIDAATGCQQCGKPLGASPSDDFCGEGCQGMWSYLHSRGRRRDASLVGHEDASFVGYGWAITDEIHVWNTQSINDLLRESLIYRSYVEIRPVTREAAWQALCPGQVEP